MKFTRFLYHFVSMLVMGFIGWIAFMRPDHLLQFGALTSLPGFLVLLFCVLPQGSRVLGLRSEKSSLARWLWRLIIGQIALLILTIAVASAFLGGGPVYVETNVPYDFIVNSIKPYLFWQWGIFPWGVYVLWGLVIAYVTYVKGGIPYSYQIASAFIPKSLEPAVKNTMEISNNAATLLSLCLTLSGIILLISYAIEKQLNTTHFALPFFTVFFLSISGLFIALKSGRRFFRRFSEKLTLNRIFLFYIILIVPILWVASLANGWFIQHHPEIVDKLICHRCGNYFANIPLATRFAAMVWGWWLIWTPLAGSYLAKISRGRTIREYIVGVYFVPFVLLAIIGVWGMAPFEWLISHLSNLNNSLVLSVLALMSWIILAKMLSGSKTSLVMSTGVMPHDSSLPRNRLWLQDASKVVGIGKYAQRIYMTLVSILFLHITAGWYGIQFQLVTLGVILIAMVYLVTVFFICHILFNRIS
ncbi:MAG: BCCT family transporter [Candidatus Berkiellales bacterium]